MGSGSAPITGFLTISVSVLEYHAHHYLKPLLPLHKNPESLFKSSKSLKKVHPKP